MQITRTSPFTGITRTMDLDVTQEAVSAWKAGTCSQDAFPNLTADEREFIQTGITQEEWDAAFPQDEE